MNSSIYATNEKGEIVHRFNSLRDAASFCNVHHSTMVYRLAKGTFFDGLSFHYSEEPQKRKSRAKKQVYIPDNDELDRDKYIIVSYETKNRVCITPCPFKYYPKPKVGSGECLKCCSFKGRDKRTKEVACSFRKKSLV